MYRISCEWFRLFIFSQCEYYDFVCHPFQFDQKTKYLFELRQWSGVLFDLLSAANFNVSFLLIWIVWAQLSVYTNVSDECKISTYLAFQFSWLMWFHAICMVLFSRNSMRWDFQWTIVAMLWLYLKCTGHKQMLLMFGQNAIVPQA